MKLSSIVLLLLVGSTASAFASESMNLKNSPNDEKPDRLPVHYYDLLNTADLA